MISSNKILKSLQFVSENSQFVQINQKAIDQYVQDFSPTQTSHWSKIYPLGYKSRTNLEDELDFIFLIGSQAFCFWGYPEKWKIKYKNNVLDGWWALVACFERALENNIPILEGEYLSKLSLKQTKDLFEGQPQIPLLKQRQKILNIIGKTLVDKYNGRFHNFYQNTNQEAFSLLENISKEFEGFNDVNKYKNKNIYFYKKTQVVISDIYEILKNKKFGQIKKYWELPGHADYKIPAILRKFNILKYNDELSKIVDNREKIKPSSDMEIEIRANMLWVTHLICQKLKLKYPNITPTVLNGILWSQSQNKSKKDKSYHLTETIYY